MYEAIDEIENSGAVSEGLDRSTESPILFHDEADSGLSVDSARNVPVPSQNIILVVSTSLERNVSDNSAHATGEGLLASTSLELYKCV